jgi:hypothetical protein
MPASDEHRDEQHTSDWLLTDGGCFAVAPFKLEGTDGLQARAKAFAGELQAVFPCVRAVYLRGSALESTRGELIKDVDIIAVLDREESKGKLGIYGHAARLWPDMGGLLRCDFGVAAIDGLKREPFSAVIQLILAFRSVLLVGKPIWKEIPKVRADLPLATRLQDSHRKVVLRFLEKASAAPAKYDVDFLVSWMQKKALRLGGILALGVSQRFSRHPLRCATLIAETYPELGEVAEAVAQQYIAGQADEVAWRLARQLFASLSGYADRMDGAQAVTSGGMVQ